MDKITRDRAGRISLKAGGVRCGVTVDAGPWVAGLPAELIKLRPRASRFPAAVRCALAVENNSDPREDYFEPDCIRLMPGHPLYASASSLAGSSADQ